MSIFVMDFFKSYLCERYYLHMVYSAYLYMCDSCSFKELSEVYFSFQPKASDTIYYIMIHMEWLLQWLVFSFLIPYCTPHIMFQRLVLCILNSCYHWFMYLYLLCLHWSYMTLEPKESWTWSMYRFSFHTFSQLVLWWSTHFLCDRSSVVWTTRPLRLGIMNAFNLVISQCHHNKSYLRRVEYAVYIDCNFTYLSN